MELPAHVLLHLHAFQEHMCCGTAERWRFCSWGADWRRLWRCGIKMANATCVEWTYVVPFGRNELDDSLVPLDDGFSTTLTRKLRVRIGGWQKIFQPYRKLDWVWLVFDYHNYNADPFQTIITVVLVHNASSFVHRVMDSWRISIRSDKCTRGGSPEVPQFGPTSNFRNSRSNWNQLQPYIFMRRLLLMHRKN